MTRFPTVDGGSGEGTPGEVVDDDVDVKVEVVGKDVTLVVTVVVGGTVVVAVTVVVGGTVVVAVMVDVVGKVVEAK